MDNDRLTKLEYEYAILSENALECIWAYDIQTKKFNYVSPNILKLRGITAEEALNDSLENSVPPETYRQAMENTALMVSRYQAGERREEMLTTVQDQPFYTINGQIRQIEVTVKLTTHPQTGAFQIVGVTRDITERKNLEHQLSQALASQAEMIAKLKKSEEKLKKLAEELRRKNTVLRSIATKDPLTGVSNRYDFDKKVVEETERSQRYGYPLSIILLDIDNFKSINDCCGHDTGDFVLSRIAKAARDSIRKQDILARWGGEEFLLLLPHTDLTAAVVTAEKLKSVIESLKHPEICSKATASFGVTEFLHGETKASWFKRVDHALFRSKSNGKNCVTGVTWDEVLPDVKVTLFWNRAWESGDVTLDTDHKRIITLTNQMLGLVNDENTENMKETGSTLISYLKMHYRQEDALLRVIRYPQAEEHIALHRALSARTDELYGRYLCGCVSASEMFTHLINNVIIGHICRDDLLFFPCLRQYNTK